MGQWALLPHGEEEEEESARANPNAVYSQCLTSKYREGGIRLATGLG